MKEKSKQILNTSKVLLTRFSNYPAAGGIVLIIASFAAIIIANSALAEAYAWILKYKFAGLSIEHWVNDALMAVFFMMVGLQIKRELLVGALATWSQRALPGFAAIGGVVIPALIYISFNSGNSDALAGWAIPAATDIAFALGVLALLGRHVPPSLKIFLSALAILDDMGAVAIIALFYTNDISIWMLVAVVAAVVVLVLMNKTGLTRLFPYMMVGFLLWFFMLKSGVHATIAGILLAFFIPLKGNGSDNYSPLDRLEHSIAPWVTFMILPLFGFANAGVALSGMTMDELTSSIPVGIALALFFGKQIGVFGLSALAILTGLAKLPEGSSWIQVYGVSILCGIGFTMSLFIGNLAFIDYPLLIDKVKVGVLAGSFMAALAGVFILRISSSAKTAK